MTDGMAMEAERLPEFTETILECIAQLLRHELDADFPYDFTLCAEETALLEFWARQGIALTLCMTTITTSSTLWRARGGSCSMSRLDEKRKQSTIGPWHPLIRGARLYAFVARRFAPSLHLS